MIATCFQMRITIGTMVIGTIFLASEVKNKNIY